MSFTYRCGPTAAIANRTSWGPVSTPTSIDPKSFDRPISGNFDRIFNSFERTNTFEIVKDTPEKEERQMVQADVVVNRKMSSSFERADCSLAAQSPCIEDEDYYREKILYSQARQLFPLQEDLADWINKTIGITYLSGENFFDVLDNGVELCQLAAVIHERAVAAADQGIIAGPVPSIRGRCWQRAARRSFFSRDNTENFITFCRDLGVHDNLLFESDDLVLHNQPRQVILCLLEVARLATRYNVEPPGLVALEKEIALEERDSGLDSAMSSAGWQFRDASPVPGDKSKAEPSPSPDGKQATSLPAEVSSPGAGGGAGGEGAGAEDARSVGSAAESLDSCDSDEPLRPTNELDKRVQLVTRLLERGCRCGAGAGRCDRLLKVKKVGEGRYNIAGRNVFIRLLKGRHMMVRVGGGWDTLEHFLSRHEPCQVRLVTPARRAAPHAAPAPAPHPAPAPAAHPSPAPSPDTPDGRTADRVHSSTHTKETSVSPTPSSASSISGKISPVDKKSRKISPVPGAKQKSPVPEAGRTTTPNKPKAARNMTLPLKTEIPKRKQSAPSLSNPNTPIGKPKTPLTDQRKSLTSNSLLLKSRSMNLAQDKKPFCGTERLNKAKSLATTPTETPKKMRSQSLASTPVSENRKSFCGTDKLNTYAKKTRSMSLASPMAFKPINKSISVTVPGPMTQAAIEESIRQSLAASIEDNSSNKPFLHIKAKYRSPPPREVPPR